MRKFVFIVIVFLILAGLALVSLGDRKSYLAGIQKVENIPSQITGAKKEGLYPGGYIFAHVVKVVDGDTIEVNYKKSNYKVRLLDVDTPESVKSGVPAQAYSKEASDLTKSLVLNQNVKLVFEKGLRDRYKRLLAYVVLKDNSVLNALLVRNGYARVEIVSPNNSLASYFYKLQEQALKEKRGMWRLPEAERPFVKDSKGIFIPSYRIKQKAS